MVNAKVQSDLRIRKLERTTGLEPFANVDWSEHFAVQDQLGNSCLGFSRAQCMWLWLKLHGQNPKRFPDPYRPYWYARVRQGKPITDSGTFTSYIWWAGKKYRDVALEGSRITQLQELLQPPKAADDFEAVDVTVKYERIVDTGARLVYRICDSLAKGQPVQLSLPVERSFLDPNGPELVGPAGDGKLDIGHAVTVIGCRLPKSRTLPDLLIGNSWGADWRMGGRCWITGAYAALSYATLYVDGVEGWQ